jgi:hypothetical protein
MISTIENYHHGILDLVNAQTEESSSSTARGNAFCQWCLENIFELSSDEARDAREVSGGNDHSIDAFIVQDERVIVVQTKFESAHSWSEITKFHYDMQRIREGKVKPFDASDKAQRVIADIQDAYELEWQVEYYYITSAKFTDNERSKLAQLAGYGVDFFFYDLQEIYERLDRKQQEIGDVSKLL